jgi:hypothetical protein
MTRKPDAVEAIARRLVDIGQWQRFTLDVDKIEVSTLGGAPTFIASGMVDVIVRLHVSPSLIPSDFITQEPK